MRDVGCRLVWFGIGALLAVAAVAGVAAAGEARVPCHQVVGELNRRVSRGQDRSPERIARRLDADPVWVAECLRMSGRRVEAPRRVVSEEEPTPRAFDPNELNDDPFFPDD